MSEPLLDRARALASAALATGALEPLSSSLHRVDGFEVRVLAGFERKPSGRGGADPFLPPYPAAMHVADWGPDHAILLNRFPVLADHLLLVTVVDQPQAAPPGAADLQALDRLLQAIDGLALYNGGREAGASQPHRHLQLVARASLGTAPLEPEIGAAAREGRSRVARFPFQHAIGPANADLGALFREVGCDGEDPGPHSLLATRAWRMVVPRTSGKVRGMPVNSLGYVGLLAVKREAQLDELAQIGPLTVLTEAGRPS